MWRYCFGMKTVRLLLLHLFTQGKAVMGLSAQPCTFLFQTSSGRFTAALAMLREDCSSICNSSLAVIYIWSRYFNPTVAYQVYLDLPQLFFPLAKKKSFGKIILINTLIYNIFKISFASYLPGHSILNLKTCCPYSPRLRDCIIVEENTWPTELTPLTSPCLCSSTPSAEYLTFQLKHLAIMHQGLGPASCFISPH